MDDSRIMNELILLSANDFRTALQWGVDRMTRHACQAGCRTPVLLLLPTTAGGLTFNFQRPTGDNANLRTTQTSLWKTLAKVNSTLFATGKPRRKTA
jgi:hypothetical protein